MNRTAFILIGMGLLIAGAVIGLTRSLPSLQPQGTIAFSSAESASASARTSTTHSVLSPGTKSVSASASNREKATQQLQILEEILVSKNDNDPRLDSELKILSEEAKTLLRVKYQAVVPEKRNERGTIVFLLGRNLTTVADYDFLKQVLSEHPCLSPADCSRPMAPTTVADHHAGSIAVVLAYPQLTALKALQNSSPASPELNAAARAALAAARASSAPLVSSYSERVQLK